MAELLEASSGGNWANVSEHQVFTLNTDILQSNFHLLIQILWEK